MTKTPWSVKITVVEMPKKACPLGYKVGDSWIVDEIKTPKWLGDPASPKRMCVSAWDTFHWVIPVFWYGGEHPRSADVNRMVRPCPGLGHEVVFELKRYRRPIVAIQYKEGPVWD